MLLRLLGLHAAIGARPAAHAAVPFLAWAAAPPSLARAARPRRDLLAPCVPERERAAAAMAGLAVASHAGFVRHDGGQAVRQLGCRIAPDDWAAAPGHRPATRDAALTIVDAFELWLSSP